MRRDTTTDLLFTSVDSLFAYLLGSLTVALGVYASWIRVDPFHEGPINPVYIFGMDTGFDLIHGHILYWSALAVGGVALLETGAIVLEAVEEYRLTPLLATVLGIASLALVLLVGNQYGPFTESAFEVAGGGYLLVVGGVLLLWAGGVHYRSG